jgi:amidase/aspartyl-tRNA(Asn)/glutamyl-tRNA(Gln) amidotransferase subunit A
LNARPQCHTAERQCPRVDCDTGFRLDGASEAEKFMADGPVDRYDLIVTPTVSAPPVDNADDGNTLGPATVAGVEVERLIGWCLTYFTNFSGHPSASIPAGMLDGRLPVGMQIIGRRYADADVLAASAAFERLRPWQDSYRLCRERAPAASA